MLFGQELLQMRQLPLAQAQASEAQRENAILFEERYNYYSNIAITRYEWEGLPESVNERFLNTVLYCMGKAAFFEDPNLGFMALPCTTSGQYNVYYEPVEVEAYSFNYHRRLVAGDPERNFVQIRNNPTCTPTAFPVFEFTRRMTDVLRTIDVLTKKMKQPFLIACEEKERLTYQNALKKIADNEIAILGSKQFGLQKGFLDFKDMRLAPDFVTLWNSYRNLENLIHTTLGIESVATEKAERLIADEVNANNMIADMSIEANIKQLQADCEKVNRTFGLNIWVEAKTIAGYTREVLSDVDVYDGAKPAD